MLTIAPSDPDTAVLIGRLPWPRRPARRLLHVVSDGAAATPRGMLPAWYTSPGGRSREMRPLGHGAPSSPLARARARGPGVRAASGARQEEREGRHHEVERH